MTEEFGTAEEQSKKINDDIRKMLKSERLHTSLNDLQLNLGLNVVVPVIISDNYYSVELHTTTHIPVFKAIFYWDGKLWNLHTLSVCENTIEGLRNAFTHSLKVLKPYKIRIPLLDRQAISNPENTSWTGKWLYDILFANCPEKNMNWQWNHGLCHIGIKLSKEDLDLIKDQWILEGAKFPELSLEVRDKFIGLFRKVLIDRNTI